MLKQLKRLVRVEKLSSNPGLHSGYWIEGHEMRPPKIGLEYVVSRYVRNGTQVDGIFSTSPVVDLADDSTFITLSGSTYKIKVIYDGE